ncbi:hypothetical protein B0H16DRAFT_1824389 [Mycena metata]|uniref:Uncharacterized protein n=1 Tax=Mycena metata TaxID=1033252 RepID=A0AAD7M9Y8_9AGAR|nr:hypothetical protein B0H16DRAFT_1824389 [Mycena metata]
MSSSPTFEELLRMPLDPSPVKDPSPPRPEQSQVATAPGSPSPQTSSARPLQRRKRPAEDMSQLAEDVSREHKLSKSDHDVLVGFSKLGRAEQSISMMGTLLALGHRQRLLQPADTPWVVPKRLHAKIDEQASILMADPSLPSYRDAKIGASKLLMDLILANPTWGFNEQAQAELDAEDSLTTTISKVLIAKRNLVKSTIYSSLGKKPTDGGMSRPGALDVVELSTLILSKLKVRGRVDLRMCGRVAILRQLILEKSDAKYWGDVDKQLEGIRTQHPDAKTQSKWIKQCMLEPDLARYKHVDLRRLTAGPSVPAVPVAGPSRLPDADTGGHSDSD